MMPGLIESEIVCPYCGESIAVLVDPSVPDQSYVEDCSVCCRPIVLHAEVESEGLVRLDARREDDS
jgi:hypothetical protein